MSFGTGIALVRDLVQPSSHPARVIVRDALFVNCYRPTTVAPTVVDSSVEVIRCTHTAYLRGRECVHPHNRAATPLWWTRLLQCECPYWLVHLGYVICLSLGVTLSVLILTDVLRFHTSEQDRSAVSSYSFLLLLLTRFAASQALSTLLGYFIHALIFEPMCLVIWESLTRITASMWNRS